MERRFSFFFSMHAVSRDTHLIEIFYLTFGECRVSKKFSEAEYLIFPTKKREKLKIYCSVKEKGGNLSNL